MLANASAPSPQFIPFEMDRNNVATDWVLGHCQCFCQTCHVWWRTERQGPALFAHYCARSLCSGIPSYNCFFNWYFFSSLSLWFAKSSFLFLPRCESWRPVGWQLQESWQLQSRCNFICPTIPQMEKKISCIARGISCFNIYLRLRCQDTHTGGRWTSGIPSRDFAKHTCNPV